MFIKKSNVVDVMTSQNHKYKGFLVKINVK